MDITAAGTFRGVQFNAAPAAEPAGKPAPAAASARSPLSVSLAENTGLDALSGVGGVSDEALRRDDPLGNLFKAAFDLPAPAMPPFAATGG